jgi:hypothetical protein
LTQRARCGIQLPINTTLGRPFTRQVVRTDDYNTALGFIGEGRAAALPIVGALAANASGPLLSTNSKLLTAGSFYGDAKKCLKDMYPYVPILGAAFAGQRYADSDKSSWTTNGLPYHAVGTAFTLAPYVAETFAKRSLLANPAVGMASSLFGDAFNNLGNYAAHNYQFTPEVTGGLVRDAANNFLQFPLSGSNQFKWYRGAYDFYNTANTINNYRRYYSDEKR